MKQIIKTLTIAFTLLSWQPVVYAQSEEDEDLAARLAEIERREAVAPSLERDVEVGRNAEEEALLKMRDVKILTMELVDVLSVLDVVGARGESVVGLLSGDDGAVETLQELLVSETARMAEKQAREHELKLASIEASSEGSSARTEQPIDEVQPDPVEAANVAVKEKDPIRVLLIRPYQDGRTKMMYRVGSAPPQATFNGSSFTANNDKYDVVSIAPIGESREVKGRNVYEVVVYNNTTNAQERWLWE